jgi:uncharacterized protein YndB with AHSA1/START domain
MLAYEREIEAPPAVVWSLLAEPRRWSQWAPHVRAPHDLGEPQVEAGRRGSVRLAGAVLVPARIVAVEPGRSWSWEVGPIRLDHEVVPVGSGSRARIEISAAGPLEAGLRLTYGPLVSALLRNLARVAERET